MGFRCAKTFSLAVSFASLAAVARAIEKLAKKEVK